MTPIDGSRPSASRSGNPVIRVIRIAGLDQSPNNKSVVGGRSDRIPSRVHTVGKGPGIVGPGATSRCRCARDTRAPVESLVGATINMEAAKEAECWTSEGGGVGTNVRNQRILLIYYLYTHIL